MFRLHTIGGGRHVGRMAWRSLQAGGRTRCLATETTQEAGAQQRRGGFGRATSLILTGTIFTALGAGATWHFMTRNGLGFHSDEDSLKRFTPSDDESVRISKHIESHLLTASLRANPALKESRPHMKMPAQYRATSLTGSALSGPGKVPVPAYAWTDGAGRELVSVIYVGSDLCGHPGIVHGGMLATMLDEGLARCCFDALPHKIAVTANLSVDYRKPTPADSYLVLRAETTKVEGRKAWVKGRVELMAAPGEKATVLAEATALFVSPKFAALMPRIT